MSDLCRWCRHPETAHYRRVEWRGLIPNETHPCGHGSSSSGSDLCLCMNYEPLTAPDSGLWSSPTSCIDGYGLRPLYEAMLGILADVFNGQANCAPALENLQAQKLELVFVISIPAEMTDRRDSFVSRYVRETIIPHGAPAPIISWEFRHNHTTTSAPAPASTGVGGVSEEIKEALDALFLSAGYMDRRSHLEGLIVTLQRERDEAVVALDKLAREVRASLGAFESEVRDAIGNTNYHALQLRETEAKEIVERFNEWSKRNG